MLAIVSCHSGFHVPALYSLRFVFLLTQTYLFLQMISSQVSQPFWSGTSTASRSSSLVNPAKSQGILQCKDDHGYRRPLLHLPKYSWTPPPVVPSLFGKTATVMVPLCSSSQMSSPEDKEKFLSMLLFARAGHESTLPVFRPINYCILRYMATLFRHWGLNSFYILACH